MKKHILMAMFALPFLASNVCYGAANQLPAPNTPKKNAGATPKPQISQEKKIPLEAIIRMSEDQILSLNANQISAIDVNQIGVNQIDSLQDKLGENMEWLSDEYHKAGYENEKAKYMAGMEARHKKIRELEHRKQNLIVRR